ncbi:MAG TPA: hypothetical protein PK322_14600 [Opitutaceae bacterium]|nr:hypothetical protein [Opitutaceae bacterium]
MNGKDEAREVSVDPAAVLGAAVSLWQACQQDPRSNLGACYGGGDQWMREVMRVATLFESWAARHACFDAFDECWPYFLEDCFGDACVGLLGAEGLARFEEADCLRVALRLRLPVACSDGVTGPLVLEAENSVAGSAFCRFRIQTMRRTSVEDGAVPMTADDDPFAEACGLPFFALYGIGVDGLPEHIADRKTYTEARELALKLAPGIAFPEVAVALYPDEGHARRRFDGGC